MIEAVFISDLHLSAKAPDITKRFSNFLHWAARSTKKIYVLGDFFHLWAGDDGLEDWSLNIAIDLAWLSDQGVGVYLMHGNRDFLLGKRFATLAKITLLSDPTVIQLNQEPILLTHGDQYCTKDKSHQWLRRATRNTLFPKVFQCIPWVFRSKIATTLRQRSQKGLKKNPEKMQIVPEAMLKQMKRLNVQTVIHGHIHQMGMQHHLTDSKQYQQIVLSDWDDSPSVLCYDKSNRFYFIPLEELCLS